MVDTATGPATGTRTRANTESVHALLRADVLAGVHPPGERLKFTPLCERYGASVSVVREALARLAEQGLVVSEPRIGFRVRELSLTDLRQLTSARIDIECMALAHAVDNGDLDWESRLVAAHHRLERTPLMTDDPAPRVSDEWESTHAEFHAVLLSGCENEWLLRVSRTLRDASEFYRRWSQLVEPGRDVAGEHAAIVERAMARDADGATTRLREHLQRTADILERSLASSAP